MRYSRVPKTLRENLEFRRNLVQLCLADRGRAAAVRELCRHDLLFWLNVFGYTHDPRKPNAVIPFLTYPFQDDFLRTIEASFGKEDVAVVKSRDMGASWLIMALFTHRWQFFDNLALGVVSREEKLVDGHPKSLFAKVDFLLERQPGFLLPRYDHIHLRLLNRDTASTMEGATTTGNVFRGDRYTAVMMDEFAAFELPDGTRALASSQAATNCRIFNSTPQGAVGAFYEVAHNRHIRRIDLHWKLHPEKAKGLIFGADGKPWSPWYARECQRMAVPAMIAQELDLDFAGSSSPFFPPDLIDRIMSQDVRPPLHRGRLEFDELDPNNLEAIKFVENAGGELFLWTHLRQPEYKPGQGEEFVVGADISAGTGATNSVLSIADRRTREKVGELASTTLSPDRFADLALALCRFFNDAFLVWEMNGPGGTFGKRVVDLGYRNIYYRQDEQGLEHKLSKNLIPGWYASTNNKLLLFREYVRCLSNGSFKNRSRDAVQECRQYVYLPTGAVGNARAHAIADPSGARENHGDRPTADALANKALGAEPDLKNPEADDPLRVPINPPINSLAYRRQKWQDEQRALASGGWEEQTSRQFQESPLSKSGW